MKCIQIAWQTDGTRIKCAFVENKQIIISTFKIEIMCAVGFSARFEIPPTHPFGMTLTSRRWREKCQRLTFDFLRTRKLNSSTFDRPILFVYTKFNFISFHFFHFDIVSIQRQRVFHSFCKIFLFFFLQLTRKPDAVFFFNLV